MTAEERERTARVADDVTIQWVPERRRFLVKIDGLSGDRWVAYDDVWNLVIQLQNLMDHGAVSN